MLRRALLLCGVLSSLLYLATDVIGGLSYDGYSFVSQAVSELMAIGAPSEHLVDPLFIAYGLLVAVFGIGVMREGIRSGRALRVTGAVLIGYAILGLTGPTLFEMHQRGTSSLPGDRAHIALTAVLVLLVLAAIAVAASALGKRFRAYSIATLSAMVLAGVTSGAYGARLAAGEPTPGFGVVERIAIYASLLWVAALAVTLRRRAVDA